MDLKQKVLDRILPEERERQESQQMFEKIREFIAEEYGLEAGLMGSLAKDTFLSGDKDLDIFVFFPESTGREELEEKGLEIGKKVFEHFEGNYEVEYAEHPYTKGEIDEFEVEIIPAYRVEGPEDLKSSVDRTPMHTEWVNENLSEEEKKEVTILKAFLKGTGLYGSSLRVKGFAGYLCEILIGEYGDFLTLLENAQDWKEEEIIDVEDHHEELPERLEKKFKEDSLVVIDPTDPDRNVASVLSRENYSKFVFKSWKFLQDYTIDYFFPEETEPDPVRIKEEIRSRGDMYEIVFETPQLTDDILYPQVRRLMRRVRAVLVKNEFQLFDSGHFIGDEKTRLVFDLQLSELPEKRKHYGPKVFHNSDNIENFMSKYPNTWVDGTRVTTIVDREYMEAEQLLEEFFSGEMQKKGVPSNLVEPLKDRKIREVRVSGPENWQSYLQEFLHVRRVKDED